MMLCKLRRVIFWVAIGIVLLVTYKTVRIGWASWSVYQDIIALRQTWNDGFDPTDLAMLESHINPLSTHLADLDQQIGSIAFILRRLAWFPHYGPFLLAIPDLTSIGHEGGLLAEDILHLSKKWPEHQEADLSMLPIALDSLVENKDILTEHVMKIEAVAHKISVADLPTALSVHWAQVQDTSAVMASILELAGLLPELSGMNQPQSYLVIMQNNHELRATGGFITSIGEVTLVDGGLDDLHFVDSYDIFHHAWPYAPLPAPMQTYMDIEILYLRDANWSPHFPTTARLIRDLYSLHTGIRAAGVVTVDLNAVALLVGTLEPLSIAGSDEPITAQNLLTFMQSAWGQPQEVTDSDEWWLSRKQFIPALVDGVLSSIQSEGIANLVLAEAMQNALNRRFIQIWVDDLKVASELAKLGWDGTLHTQKGADYLALVDSNLGFSKVDAVLQRSVDYTVAWPLESGEGREQRARATVKVTYHHTLEKLEHSCDITPRYGREGAIYEELFERCYFGYPRLYVPSGSELIAIQGVIPDSVSSEKGEAYTEIFAGYFTLEPGMQHQIIFEYWLPSTIMSNDYRLVIERQAGLEMLPLRLDIGGKEDAFDLTEGMVLWDDF